MSEIRATTISNAAGTGPITMIGQSAAKAWVNFNGVGTVAIRESGNVSSIADNQTGAYTVNFTTAMTDANYSPITAGGDVSGIGGRSAITDPYTPTTTSVGVTVVNTSTVLVDVTLTTISVIR